MDQIKSAVESGDVEALREILRVQNLDADSLRDGYEILNFAAQHRAKEVVLLLVERGFPVNRPHYLASEATALHRTAERDCPDMIRFLIDAGASVDLADAKNYNTPVMIAFRKGNVEAVDFMLRHAKRNDPSIDGLTHMHIACARNCLQVAKKFLQLGAAIDRAVDFHEPTFGGYTALHFAAQHEALEAVELLVACGARVSLKDARGMTALHVAYEHGKNRGILNAILAAHVYDNSNPEDPERVSHFHIACTTCNARIVEAFLKHDENSDTPGVIRSADCRGFTPLHFAIDGGSEEVVRLLLDYGADPTQSSNNKMRPVEYAKSLGKWDIVELIHSRTEVQSTVFWNLKNVLTVKTNGKEINSEKKIYPKKTPKLHVACTQDILSAVINVVQIIQEMTLKEGERSIDTAIDLDSPIWPGCTALHLAVEYNNVAIVEELLKHGADVTIKDARGFTPLHLAFRRGRRAIVDVILSKRGLDSLSQDDARTDPSGLSHFHIFCACDAAGHAQDYLAVRPGALELRVDDDSTFRPGYAGLHFAVEYRAVEAFRALVARGASCAARTAHGQTPLDLVAEGMRAAGRDRSAHLAYLDFVEAILDGEEAAAARGITRLHVACARNDLEAVRALVTQRNLDGRVDEDLGFWAGYTPLHVAVDFRNREVAELLLSNLAVVNARDARGNGPLHLLLASTYPYFESQACSAADKQREFADWLDMLLDAGADINLKNHDGCTLQAMSVKLNHRFPLIKIILERGANVDAVALPAGDRGALIKHKTLLHVLGVRRGDAFDPCLPRSEQEAFRANCLRELDRMKRIKISYRFSLHDVLRVDVDRTPELATNDELRRIVDSEDLDARFEIYGFMIKLLFKRVLLRRELMAKSEKSLAALTGLHMPVTCLETIYKYLDNENLRNVVRAYKLHNEKKSEI